MSEQNDPLENPERGHAGGMPPHVPTAENRKMVSDYASYGITHEDIAKALGVCENTLRKYYRQELDTAVAAANAKVARRLHSLAVDDGNVAAAIFWLKVRADWREKAPEADPNSRPVVNIYNGLPEK